MKTATQCGVEDRAIRTVWEGVGTDPRDHLMCETLLNQLEESREAPGSLKNWWQISINHRKIRSYVQSWNAACLRCG